MTHPLFVTDLINLLRAEDGTQTRDPQLGRLMLYQLSYFRKSPPPNLLQRRRSEHWQTFTPLIFSLFPSFGGVRGGVGSEGFEPPKSKDS
jgi:hypothetical protein